MCYVYTSEDIMHILYIGTKCVCAIGTQRGVRYTHRLLVCNSVWVVMCTRGAADEDVYTHTIEDSLSTIYT